MTDKAGDIVLTVALLHFHGREAKIKRERKV